MTKKKCSLRLFTWTRKSVAGQREVAPVCPTHPSGKVHFGRFGTGMIVVCELGTHLVGLCDSEQFETEVKRPEANCSLKNWLFPPRIRLQ